jgi:hypothetical protein
MRRFGLILVRYSLRAVRSLLSEQQLSIATLSQALPERLIEQTTPSSNPQSLELLTCVLAAVIAACIDQPTTRRENRSMTADR